MAAPGTAVAREERGVTRDSGARIQESGKDTDPDIPILKQAKAEYAKLE
jgi:hypothetical protein